MNRKLLSFLFITFILFCFNNLNAQVREDYIILDGVHKISSDDNHVYSLPSYDDSKWRSIVIPGSWQSQGFNPREKIGWYRIHCVIPSSFRDIESSLFLGRIGDADEVFFNGIKIGGEGKIGQQFIEASKIRRLYKIPHKYIRFDADNVIAVRVMNTYLSGGILDKGVIIGDHQRLLFERLRRHKDTLIWESCFFTFFALFFLSCLFFYIKGLRDREYFYFWLFITLYGTLFFLGSVTFYYTGFKTPFIQKIIMVISAILPAVLLLLLLHFYKEKLTLYLKMIILTFFGVAILIIFFHANPFYDYIYLFWKILFFSTGIYLIVIAIKAFLRKFYESGTILLGIMGLITGSVLESVIEIDLAHITGFFLWDYSTVLFMLSVVYALASRYTRIKELQSASIKIFNAHEKERKRLARELHDGIGTSLLAIKMKLQMLETRVKGGVIDQDAFSVLISEISHVIEELRRVSMDLRPSFLKNTDLVEAINWYIKKVQDRSGIEINVEVENVDKVKEVSLKIKENIYRILQEALSNIVRHSNATNANIALKIEGGMLIFDIRDNGKGFNPAQKESKEAGIGLFTIMERVELLNGIIRIKSSDDTGTHIFIEVPLE